MVMLGWMISTIWKPAPTQPLGIRLLHLDRHPPPELVTRWIELARKYFSLEAMMGKNASMKLKFMTFKKIDGVNPKSLDNCQLPEMRILWLDTRKIYICSEAILEHNISRIFMYLIQRNWSGIKFKHKAHFRKD